jgi:pimeloyl-ACP methyl ester carboxylesterase
MRTHYDFAADGQPARRLLVLLPPAKASLEDLTEQGFVAAVRSRRLALDVVLADASPQRVLAQTAVRDLHRQVIAPAKARGYAEIWLAGISLGGFNALDYAASHAAELAGIKLIAPYPGTGDILNEIEAAGGAAAWASAPDCPLADERRWWHWLSQEAQRGASGLPIWLGLSQQDRFRRGQALLAALLPAARTRLIAGDHCWPAWRTLWQQWLDEGPLAHPDAERTV